ncbi:MAG: hypothetical protein JJT76_17190 [Clostridiaceae bacterium]|nr:hypothetical protein [Clostridiaceae bacterium]
METICPICNSLASYIVQCPTCHNKMEAQGAIEEYFDDYSPYLDREITEKLDGVAAEKCLHIFYCTECGRDKRIPIDKIIM